ncbi:MAG: hypothetical protein QOJ15_9930 [Bradyrhizobium sp.]|nr:hypothetical protein [Bradyrhizobium sp.]
MLHRHFAGKTGSECRPAYSLKRSRFCACTVLHGAVFSAQDMPDASSPRSRITRRFQRCPLVLHRRRCLGVVDAATASLDHAAGASAAQGTKFTRLDSRDLAQSAQQPPPCRADARSGRYLHGTGRWELRKARSQSPAGRTFRHDRRCRGEVRPASLWR